MDILNQLSEINDKSHLMSIVEKKDHLIKKMPLLDDEQKKEIIKFFTDNPSFENEIDWNKISTLEYSDFEEVLSKRSKTKVKKAVKASGIKGLIEGKDYIEIKDVDFDENNKDGVTLQGVYIPITYEASVLIGSNKIGGVDAKWCIASNDMEFWFQYSFGIGSKQFKANVPSTFPMFIFADDDRIKYTIQCNDEYAPLVWDRHDTSSEKPDTIPGIDVDEFINKHKSEIDSAHNKINEHYEDFEGLYEYESAEHALEQYMVDVLPIGKVLDFTMTELIDLDIQGMSSYFIDIYMRDQSELGRVEHLEMVVVEHEYDGGIVKCTANHKQYYYGDSVEHTGLYCFYAGAPRKVYFKNNTFGYYTKLDYDSFLNVVGAGEWIELQAGDEIRIRFGGISTYTGSVESIDITDTKDESSIAISYDLEFSLYANDIQYELEYGI